MSPVSRGRKRKKKGGPAGKGRVASRTPVVAEAGGRPSAWNAMQRLLGPPERPRWFDAATKTVLDDAVGLMSATGPRELEQAVAELLGAELHRALHQERQGLWFGWWLEELLVSVTARLEEEVATGTCGPSLRLIHGLAALGTPALEQLASTALRRAVKRLRTDPGLPEWLRAVPRVRATGDVVRMCDAYGTRMAVITDISYGPPGEPAAFLFDIDVSGFVKLVGAGVFDDAELAASAWRENVGDAAADASAEPVADADELLCLVHCDVGEEQFIGNESQVVMDNWFRAQRRVDDLASALRKRGMPLPSPESLYQEVDVTPMTTEFTTWHLDRFGARPDDEVVQALAEEWMEGTIPATWYAASPQRVQFQLGLISDWAPDHPVTVGVKALMPEWVRWLGERASLPEALRDRLVSAAMPTSGRGGRPVVS